MRGIEPFHTLPSDRPLHNARVSQARNQRIGARSK